MSLIYKGYKYQQLTDTALIDKMDDACTGLGFEMSTMMDQFAVSVGIGSGGLPQSGHIWYVDLNLDDNGDGSLTAPFNNVADANAAVSNYFDGIFVINGGNIDFEFPIKNGMGYQFEGFFTISEPFDLSDLIDGTTGAIGIIRGLSGVYTHDTFTMLDVAGYDISHGTQLQFTDCSLFRSGVGPVAELGLYADLTIQDSSITSAWFGTGIPVAVDTCPLSINGGVAGKPSRLTIKNSNINANNSNAIRAIGTDASNTSEVYVSQDSSISNNSTTNATIHLSYCKLDVVRSVINNDATTTSVCIYPSQTSDRVRIYSGCEINAAGSFPNTGSKINKTVASYLYISPTKGVGQLTLTNTANITQAEDSAVHFFWIAMIGGPTSAGTIGQVALNTLSATKYVYTGSTDNWVQIA